MRGTFLAAAAAALLFTPARADGQIVCGPGHTMPLLPRSGVVQTLPPLAGWIQVGAFRQHSTEFFDAGGDPRKFLDGGNVTTRSLFLTGAVGLRVGLEAWVQVPLHSLRFEDASGVRRRTGLGDARLSLRFSPAMAGYWDLPFAFRAGVKLPGSEFPVDATIIPLTEGQRDWEIAVESGRAIGFTPVHVFGWVGYRWREENRPADRKPGDEAFAHLALGGTVRSIRLELAIEGLRGRPAVQQGLRLPTARRNLVQFLPAAGFPVGPGTVDLRAQIPATGRNLPTGPGLSVGYLWAWQSSL